MKPSVIARFHDTYGEKVKFPEILKLEEGKALEVVDALRIKLGIPLPLKQNKDLKLPSFSTDEMFSAFENEMEVLKDVNPAPEKFSLKETLLKINIIPNENIYYYFDALYTAKFEDINKYFYGLCKPGAGNIFIFDDSFEWICCVMNNQVVGIVIAEEYKKKRY